MYFSKKQKNQKQIKKKKVGHDFFIANPPNCKTKIFKCRTSIKARNYSKGYINKVLRSLYYIINGTFIT